ncbi:MAG TPA: hypothetical protein VM165_12595 [Planctomycetaceae bacterium]|nr:hypothetical protein [Planctomycetaceae bacterium]
MTEPEFRKQISIFLPVADWKAVRLEAARRRIPMTALCREWLAPGLDRLRREPPRSPDEETA